MNYLKKILNHCIIGITTPLLSPQHFIGFITSSVLFFVFFNFIPFAINICICLVFIVVGLTSFANKNNYDFKTTFLNVKNDLDFIIQSAIFLTMHVAIVFLCYNPEFNSYGFYSDNLLWIAISSIGYFFGFSFLTYKFELTEYKNNSSKYISLFKSKFKDLCSITLIFSTLIFVFNYYFIFYMYIFGCYSLLKENK